MKSALVFLFIILSVSEAARRRPFYFNLYNELEGSWAVMETKMSSQTGEPIGLSNQLMYNFTKSDIPNELLIEEYDLQKHETIRRNYQMIVSASDNYTARAYTFQPGTENEIQDIMKIHFEEFLRAEYYYTCGTLVSDPSIHYELSILPRQIIKLEFTHEGQDEKTVYMAKKIIIPKAKTFLERYGPYFMIAFAFIVQMVMTSMNTPQF